MIKTLISAIHKKLCKHHSKAKIEHIDLYTDGCLIKYSDAAEPLQVKYREDRQGNLKAVLVNNKLIIPFIPNK